MANPRSFSAGRFALYVDGEAGGFIKSVEGGFPTAEVAIHTLGASQVQKKHITTIKYPEIKMEMATGMTRATWDWIKLALDAQDVTKSGVIHAANNEYKVMRSLEFYDAHMKSFTLPKCDASSKEGQYCMIEVSPQRTKPIKGDGTALSTKIGTKSKKWTPSAFECEIAGLPCDRVSKIGDIKIDVELAQDAVGKFRDPTKHVAAVKYPDIEITFSAADGDEWDAYFEDFVIKGNCGDGNEKEGSITWFQADQKTPLATLNMYNMGILSLTPAKFEAGKASISSLVAKLYMERCEIKLEGDAVDM